RRLAAGPFPLARWLAEARRSDYWRAKSVRDALGAIRCPVFAVSGWADGYRDVVPRLVRRLGGPAKGLVGPAAHVFPHQGTPGPAIGFLQEARRWFARWLADEPNGVDAEPRFVAYVEEYGPGPADPEARPGRFVAAPGGPDDGVRTLRFRFGATALH